jgi:hypothetical protein
VASTDGGGQAGTVRGAGGAALLLLLTEEKAEGEERDDRRGPHVGGETMVRGSDSVRAGVRKWAARACSKLGRGVQARLGWAAVLGQRRAGQAGLVVVAGCSGFSISLFFQILFYFLNLDLFTPRLLCVYICVPCTYTPLGGSLLGSRGRWGPFQG